MLPFLVKKKENYFEMSAIAMLEKVNELYVCTSIRKTFCKILMLIIIVVMFYQHVVG